MRLASVLPLIALVFLTACETWPEDAAGDAPATPGGAPQAEGQVLSLADQIPVPFLVAIPSGEFVMGSTLEEREYAYQLDEAAYGTPVTRKQRWYEGEIEQRVVFTRDYFITKSPITNAQYQAFVEDQQANPPEVDALTWQTYGLIHPYESTRKFTWSPVGDYPRGRRDHPVVLVSAEEARTYAQWLSIKTGQRWRLPTETEWEKAARGIDGRRFPWGDRFDPSNLNSNDTGYFDTLPAGTFPDGASPWGVLDMAGQVYEWTSTLGEGDRVVVKGGSWDDKGCGVCRAAARHMRPVDMKHMLIGFRLVMDPQE